MHFCTCSALCTTPLASPRRMEPHTRSYHVLSSVSMCGAVVTLQWREGLGAVWPQDFNCSNFPTSHQGELCYLCHHPVLP